VAWAGKRIGATAQMTEGGDSAAAFSEVRPHPVRV